MSDDANKAGAAGGSAQLETEPEVAEIEVPALSALLKRSLASADAEAASSAASEKEVAEMDRALLAGVQRKLRQRSKGKFYADGWSTSQSRINYVLVAGMMLVVIIVVYLALGPMGISLN